MSKATELKQLLTKKMDLSELETKFNSLTKPTTKAAIQSYQEIQQRLSSAQEIKTLLQKLNEELMTKFNDKTIKSVVENISKLREMKIDCTEANSITAMFKTISKTLSKLKSLFSSSTETNATNDEQSEQNDEINAKIFSMMNETCKQIDSSAITDISKILKTVTQYQSLQTTVQDLKSFNITDSKFMSFVTRIEALIWAKEVDLCLSTSTQNTSTATSAKQITKLQLQKQQQQQQQEQTQGSKPSLDQVMENMTRFESLKKTNKIVKEACVNLKSLNDEMSAFMKIVQDFENKKYHSYIQQQYEIAPKIYSTPVPTNSKKITKQQQQQEDPLQGIQNIIREIEEVMQLSKQLSTPLQNVNQIQQSQTQLAEELKYMQWCVEVFQKLKEKKGSLIKKECQNLIERAQVSKVGETYYLYQQMNDKGTKKTTQISKQNLKNILGDDSLTMEQTPTQQEQQQPIVEEEQQQLPQPKNKKTTKNNGKKQQQNMEIEQQEQQQQQQEQVQVAAEIAQPKTTNNKKLTKKQQQQQQQQQQLEEEKQKQTQLPEQMEIEVEKKQVKKPQQITMKKWNQMKNEIAKKMERCFEVIDDELTFKDKTLFEQIENDFHQLVQLVSSNQVTLNEKDRKEYDLLDLEISLNLLLLKNDRKQRIEMWEKILDEVDKRSNELNNYQFYKYKLDTEIHLYKKLIDAVEEIYNFSQTLQSLNSKTRKNLRTSEDQQLLNEGIKNCSIAVDIEKIQFLSGLLKQSEQVMQAYNDFIKKITPLPTKPTKKNAKNAAPTNQQPKITKDEVVQLYQQFRNHPFYFTQEEKKIETMLDDIEKLEKKLKSATTQKLKEQALTAYQLQSQMYIIPVYETIIADQQQAKITIENAAEQCINQLQKLGQMQNAEISTFAQVQETENLMILINDNLEQMKPLEHPQFQEFTQMLDKHKTKYYVQLFNFIKNSWDRETIVEGLDRKFLKIKVIELESLIRSDAGGFENDRLKIAKFFVEDILKKIEDTILEVSNLRDNVEISKFKQKVGFFSLVSYLSEQKSSLKANSSLNNSIMNKSKQSAEISLTKKQLKMNEKAQNKQQKLQQYEENTIQEDEHLLGELGGDLSDIKPENTNKNVQQDEDFQLTDNDLEMMQQDKMEDEDFKQQNKKNLQKLKKKSEVVADKKKPEKQSPTSQQQPQQQPTQQKLTEAQTKTKNTVHKIAFLIKNNPHWNTTLTQLEIMEYAVKFLSFYEKTHGKDTKLFNYHVQSLCQFLFKLKEYSAISQKIAKTKFSMELINNLKLKTNLFLDNLERKEVILNEEEKKQMDQLESEYYFSKEQLKKKAKKQQQVEDDSEIEDAEEEYSDEEEYDDEDEEQSDIVNEHEIAVYKVFDGNLKHTDFKTMPQVSLISHTKSIIVRQFPAIVKQIMNIQECMPISSFLAYLENIYKQEQETNQRKKQKIVSGWVESQIDIHQNIIDNIAEKHMESDSVSIINCGTNLNLYLMNVHQMPAEIKQTLYFTQYQHISSIRAPSPLMFVLIYSGAKPVNKQSDYTLQPEIMANYVDARLKNNKNQQQHNNSFQNRSFQHQQQQNQQQQQQQQNNNNQMNAGLFIKRFFQLTQNLPQNQLMIFLNTLNRTFNDQSKMRQILNQKNRQAQSNLQSNIMLQDLRNNMNLDFKAINPQALEIFATNTIFRTNTSLINRLIQIAKNKYSNPNQNNTNNQQQNQQYNRFKSQNKENNYGGNNNNNNNMMKKSNSHFNQNNMNRFSQQQQQQNRQPFNNMNNNVNYQNNNNYNNQKNNQNQNMMMKKFQPYNNNYNNNNNMKYQSQQQENNNQFENPNKFVYSTEQQGLERFKTY